MVCPPRFTIRIRDGKAEATQGKVMDRVVAECSNVARERGLSGGTIYGMRRGDGVSLVFSKDVPEPDRQRFRNTWVANR